MNKEFTRVRSIKDIVVFASLIAGGSVLIALPTSTGVNITGFFLIFAGLILALVLRTGYKDIETGDKYLKKEIYFQQTMRSDIITSISSDPSSVDLTQEDKGNALKLDVYYSRPLNKAYIQLFEYVPYNYQPCSLLYEYEVNKVNKLIK